MSPRTIPHITARADLKPEASALATVAKTPGPGLTARTSIATENPMAEYTVKFLSFPLKWFPSLISQFLLECFINLQAQRQTQRIMLRRMKGKIGKQRYGSPSGMIGYGVIKFIGIFEAHVVGYQQPAFS